MRLLLLRHGNTFEQGEMPRMVGANEDLPLTEEGRNQIIRMREAFESCGVQLDKIISGPLKRQQESAQIISQSRITVETDPRLGEIDYGSWSGLSNDQISMKYGLEELTAWNEKGIWPPSGNFKPSENEVREDVLTLSKDLQSGPEQCVLLVSSNGRLRYFLNLISGEYESKMAAGRLKIRTGNLAIIDIEESGARVAAWNIGPGTVGQYF